MTRTVFSGGYFQPPEDAYAAFEITPTIGRKRLFVMTISGGSMPHGNALYPPEALHSDAGNLPYPVAPWAAKVLPGAERTMSGSEGEFYWTRPIEGSVVKDAQGRLCEVVGHELRRLHCVVRSPHGQFLELLARPTYSNSRSEAENIIDGKLVLEPKDRLPVANERMAAKRTAPRQAVSAGQAGCRRLFAEPGLPRVVELGKFRRILGPQLAYPERLRDLHRLVCYVQVYQALTRQRADEFLEAIHGADNQNIPMEPLSEESVVLLELKEFLAQHPRPLRNPLWDPGYVLPFECFYSLRISSDPTADKNEAREPGVSQVQKTEPESTVALPRVAAPQQNQGPSSNRSIPERFQNPWEFQFSRDEVLYDMTATSVSRKSLGNFLRKAARWFRGREEFRKWRALLCVKSLEEQLWSVRPPHGSVSERSVRDWARQTLDAAGYDSRSMLREWEIFWRRKGI